jgi:hypothetical protein
VKHAKHRERSRAAGGHGNWMPTGLSDEPPKKTSIMIICDVQDPFIFLHRRSQVLSGMPERCTVNAAIRSPAALPLRPCCSGTLGLSLFSSHAGARPCSRDAGGLGKYIKKRSVLSSSRSPGGSDAKDAFQHAAFTGNKKKRQKQRGRRRSAAGIHEPIRNSERSNWHADATKR